MNTGFLGIDTKIALQNGEPFLYQSLRFALVPEAGLEPARCCQPGILSPVRLPIPPFRPGKYYNAKQAALATYF